MSTSTGTPHEFFGPLERYTLDNGLTVLLKPVDHSRSLTAQVWVRAGSAHEDETNNGLSHLLEHMIFKGTERFSGREVNDLVEKAGGRQNAATSKEYTKFYVTLPSKHWERALELLSQMAFHARLPEDEFDKERRVVLSELDRYRDNPRRRLWLDFVPGLYGDHPYGRLTIGTRDVLESVTHAQLVDYYERFYRPENTTLVLAGRFPGDGLEDAVREYFGGSSTLGNDRPERDLPTATPSGGRIQRRTADVSQAYALLGTVGPEVDSDRAVAMDLLAELLGGSRDSRLYQRLVIDESTASSVSVSFLTLQAGGPLMVRLESDPSRLDEAVESLREISGELASEGVGSDELARAKTSRKSDVTYAAQTASGQATKLGYWENLGELNRLEEYLERLNDVSNEELRELAQKYLREPDWSGALVVP